MALRSSLVLLTLVIRCLSIPAVGLAQTERCDLVSRNPVSRYCFARTYVEALGRLDQLERPEHAIKKASGDGDATLILAAGIAAMQRQRDKYIEGAKDLEVFATGADTAIREAALESQTTFRNEATRIEEAEQFLVATMDGTSHGGVGTRAKRMAEFQRRQEYGAKLIVLSAVGVTFTMVADSGRLALTRGELRELRAAIQEAFQTKSLSGPWWDQTSWRQAALALIQVIEDPGWQTR